MAFNLQTFKTRALSAVVFVIIMLIGLGWNQWTFLALFSVIHFGCWVEYQKLVGLIEPGYQKINVLHRYGVVLFGWGLMLRMTGYNFSYGGILVSEMGRQLVLIGGIIVLLPNVVAFIRKEDPRLLSRSVLGLFYISVSWGCMMQLWGNLDQSVFNGYNGNMPILLIASIWINDTMAYIVGSFIGKTPFSPISPKKTWEGTIGGALLAVAAVTLVGYYGFGFNISELILLSSIAAVAGTAGDLFESKLKRLAGVKDSGNMMPGHGGFLDRFDSLLLATTVAWIVFSLVY